MQDDVIAGILIGKMGPDRLALKEQYQLTSIRETTKANLFMGFKCDNVASSL